MLLDSMVNESNLESTVVALRLKDTADLMWRALTADIIQEYERKSEGFGRAPHKN